MRKVALSLAVVAASGVYVLAQGAAPPTEALAAGLPDDPAATGGLQDRGAGLAAAGGTARILEPAVAAPPANAGEGDAAAADAGPPALPAAAASEAAESAPAAPLPSVSPSRAPTRALAPPQPADIAEAEPAPSAEPPPGAAAAVPAAPPPPAALATPVPVPLPRLRPAPRATRVSAAHAAPVDFAAASGLSDGTFTGPAIDAYYGMVQVQAVVQGGKLVTVNVLRYPSDRRTSQFINRQALPLLRSEVIRAQSARVDIVSGATLTSRAFIRSLDAALRQANA